MKPPDQLKKDDITTVVISIFTMRTYIFTEEEEKCLIRYLKNGEESHLALVTLSRVRNADRLAAHVKLMALALKKLKQDGRLMGRLKLPSDSSSRLRDVG